MEYISEPDENLSDYLFSLAQSYFIVNVLRLDPECNSCTRESLQRKRAFMDTNVIMHALIGKQQRYSFVDSALKLAKQLGIQLLFSKRTKAEFDSLIQDAKRNYKFGLAVPKNRFHKIENELTDGFLKDFEPKKEKSPHLEFEGYLQRLEHIDAILKTRYAAIYDESDYDNVSEDPDLPSLASIVIDEGNRFGLFKSKIVAEHYAFHILLIHHLRSKEENDFLGPNHWFLTHDRSLYPSERRFGKFGIPTSSIFVDEWVQLFSPLISPELTKTAKDTYTALFASRLPMLSKTIDDEVFLTFQGAWIDDEDLTAQDVAKIIGQNYLRNLHKKLAQEGKQLTTEERELIIAPIVEEIKAQKRNMEEAKKKIANLGRIVFKLKGNLSALEKTVNKQYAALKTVGHVLGAVIFLSIWYILFQHILIGYLEPWQAFIGAILIAAIFGYLADFHGYRWLLGMLLGKNSKNREQTCSEHNVS